MYQNRVLNVKFFLFTSKMILQNKTGQNYHLDVL